MCWRDVTQEAEGSEAPAVEADDEPDAALLAAFARLPGARMPGGALGAAAAAAGPASPEPAAPQKQGLWPDTQRS